MKWKWILFFIQNVQVKVIQQNFLLQKFTVNSNVSVYYPVPGKLHHKPLFVRFIKNPIHNLHSLYIEKKYTLQDELNSSLSIKSFNIQLKIAYDPYLSDIRNTHLGHVSFQFENQTLNSDLIYLDES
jgi:hypothetical protein